MTALLRTGFGHREEKRERTKMKTMKEDEEKEI
jgi:hypothetical protein